MAKILISGGTGVIGRRLMNLLRNAGHDTVLLSRKKQAGSFYWDPENKIIDPDALEGIDHLVNLAGAGVMEKRWTDNYRKKIIDSRVKSVEFLFDAFDKNGAMPLSVCGASAIGFYGMASREGLMTERSEPGKDFLADVCVEWENSYNKFLSAGCRVNVIRTGIVLSTGGGAYPTLATSFKSGLGVILGSGQQAFPWIHLDDECGIIMHLLENKHLQGTWNLVAPALDTMDSFSNALARSFGRRIILPRVPGFIMRLLLGERAVALTGGTAISAQKILSASYQFKFKNAASALASLAGTVR